MGLFKRIRKIAFSPVTIVISPFLWVVGKTVVPMWKRTYGFYRKYNQRRSKNYNSDGG